MRNFVPTVDQSPLAGCTSARLGIVDAGQRRARDCGCEAVRRQSSIHLQLAPRLGARRPRWPDQRACRWSAKEAERCVVGDRVRTGEDGGVDAAGLGTASGRDSRYALSAITRSAGRHSQEKRIQFQTHPHESKKNRDPERFAACAAELAGLKTWARDGGCQLVYYDEAGFSASPPVQRAWSPLGCPHAVTPAHHQRVAVMGALDFAGQRLYHAQREHDSALDEGIQYLPLLLAALQSGIEHDRNPLEAGQVSLARVRYLVERFLSIQSQRIARRFWH